MRVLQRRNPETKGERDLGSLYNDMVRFFLNGDWQFTPIEGKPLVRLGFSGKNGNWTCLAQAKDEQQQVIFYSICSVNVPEDKRQAVAEFLTRANYGLILGNFELDFDDGEVRYKTSVDVGGDGISSEMMEPLIYVNLAMMDKYLPGLMAVTFGDVSPAESVRNIED